MGFEPKFNTNNSINERKEIVMKNIFQNKYVIIIATLVIGIVIGWLISPSAEQPITTSSQPIITSNTWTCSMHPSVRQSEPGQCPICGMDLIPLGNEEDGGDPMEVKMSETAMKLANIQTTLVGTGNSLKEVRLNGKVQADERRITTQTSHLPGRIEKLMINFTGEYVQKGQEIAKVYSPELVTAQQELLEANKIKNEQPELLAAAKAKLKNWKLMDSQINQILQAGKPMTEFPLRADFSGIVLSKKISLGDHVVQGQPLYEIVDLSQVWVLFDVYENDLSWIKKNSEVTFTIQSLPGEVFKNKISFIDPLINPETRVATARIEMTNPGLRLKPEMFATAIVKTDLKGGNDIIVPKSAVMWTGERSVVYVKNMTDAGISFRMTEVTLGPSLGDAYVINEGLTAGMEVVTNGTFTIDAAAQLAGKPSMMNPATKEDVETKQHKDDHHQMGSAAEVNDQFKNQVSALLQPYLKVKDALVKTNAKETAAAARGLKHALAGVDISLVKGEMHSQWMKMSEALNSAVSAMSNSTEVEEQRKLFSDFSDNFYTAIQQFNLSGLEAYYQYCPMAFNNTGAHWISQTKEIQNPYFGDKMMRCGITKSELK